MFFPCPQPAGIAYMTSVAPPALTGTAISLMATVTWVVGKAVKSSAWYYDVFNADDLNNDDDEDDNDDDDGGEEEGVTMLCLRGRLTDKQKLLPRGHEVLWLFAPSVCILSSL